MSKPPVPTKEAIKAKIEQQLETDDRLKAWFQQYRKDSWKSFINGYAHTKSLALTYPDLHIDEFKPKNKEFNDLARKALKDIQQKKLFNLQCQWRAGSIELPFVQVTYDFRIFEQHIMQCPFLPPVEMDEVELFIQFLKSPNSAEYFEGDCPDWQDYDEFKEEQETGEFGNTPDWYEFFDSMRGTGYLLNLPDNRGQKQEYYREIAINQEFPDRASHVRDPEQDKPFLHASEADIDFAKLFEDADTAEIIISHIKATNHRENHEYLDEHYEYLKKIPDTFPFVHHHDWREAIYLTVARYKADQVAEVLPRIWRQYIRDVDDDRDAYVSKRIASASKNLMEELDKDKLRHYYIDRVLKGRKLIGEPEDFDY